MVVKKMCIRDRYRLAAVHKLELDADIEKMTKNEASRTIDKILAQYGKLTEHVEKP